jgi:hypothetical protein
MEPHGSRQELEALWRERIKSARTKYDLALAETRGVLAGPNGGFGLAPDHSTAVRNALLRESAARNEYMQVLRTFTDLLVYGKIPEDHPGSDAR